jgi:xylulokinase
MVRCVAAVDCGTTSIKCAYVDLQGRTVSQSTAASPLKSGSDGAVEVDAAGLLAGVCGGLAACAAQADRADVLACAVTGQRATVFCLDGDGRAVGPGLCWQDLRGGPLLDPLRRSLPNGEYFELTGLPNFPVFTLAKLLWVREREPERWRRTRRFALVHDLVVAALGGDGDVTDLSNASLTGLLDLGARRWSERLLALTGLDPDRLGRLVEPGTPVGRVSRAAAGVTGLREGTPLVAGAGDQQCGGLGAGAVTPGTVEITLGTAAVPLCGCDCPALDPRRRVTCCVHAVPGQWNVEGLQNAAGASVRWLATLCGAADGFRREAWEAAGRVAPGADGALFLPYLLGAGAPWWNAEASGTWVGLRPSHGPAHALRAVLEGVALENAAILEVFRELSVSVSEVRLTGGISGWEPWNRIQAGIYGVPVVTLENPQATLLGAAILAACGAGAHPSPSAAAGRMVRVRDRFDPDPAERAACEALRVRHREARERLAGLWKHLACGGGS